MSIKNRLVKLEARRPQVKPDASLDHLSREARRDVLAHTNADGTINYRGLSDPTLQEICGVRNVPQRTVSDAVLEVLKRKHRDRP